MIKPRLLAVSFLVCSVFCLNAEAKLFKWVDEHGTTHYGETIPPEYASSTTMKLEKGRVEKLENKQRVDEKADQAAKAAKTPENQAKIDARRHDNALLNTYSNEKEIDLARDRSLSQVEARISSYSTLLKSAQETIVQLHQESDDRIKNGRKIPQSLADDITAGEDRIEKLKVDLDQSQKESTTVKARYDADKQRFRELKGMSPDTK